MSRRARVAFGWTALALWLLSLALPAYRAPTEVQPGWLVLLIGWVGVLGSWLPPGSPLGWFANVLTPAFAVVLIRGRRVGRWGGGVTLFLATHVDSYWDTRFDVLKGVKQAFDAEGISLPYPIQVSVPAPTVAAAPAAAPSYSQGG